MKNEAAIVMRSSANRKLVLAAESPACVRAMYRQDISRKQLRDIDEFSFTYKAKWRKGVFLAAALIIFSIFCIALFSLHIDVMPFFMIGAVLIGLQLIQCGIEISQEGMRTQKAYRAYLAGFSIHVLYHLRKTATLSAWSQYEIDQYLRLMS
jgi:hypothetical protein